MTPPAAVLMALWAHPPLYAASPIPAAAFALANPLQLAFAVELRRGRRLSCLAAHGVSGMGFPCSSATISVPASKLISCLISPNRNNRYSSK